MEYIFLWEVIEYSVPRLHPFFFPFLYFLIENKKVERKKSPLGNFFSFLQITSLQNNICEYEMILRFYLVQMLMFKKRTKLIILAKSHLTKKRLPH